jgi:F0F1-type ATP synthase assembly protein I
VTEEPTGQEPGLRPVSAAALTAAIVTGLVVGWLARLVLEAVRDSAPVVTWLPALAFGFVAAILAWTARATRRSMQEDRDRPSAQAMVNRFVLARACALVAAVAAGAYAGYALTWVGSSADLVFRMVRPAAASVSAGLMTLAAVFLERACRVSSDDDEP